MRMQLNSGGEKRNSIVSVFQRRLILFFFPAALLFFLSCEAKKETPTQPAQPPASQVDQAALSDLNNVTHALSGSSPYQGDAIGNSDLSPLDDLNAAHVVGLGEATHGTREFFEMKHRIFKYLVEKHGFKAFAFECDYGESIFFDRYINGGPGDIDELMRTRMHFWTWKTIEVRALLEWMRSFNTAKAEAEKIHYIGVDCQYKTYQPMLLRQYLGAVSSSYLSEVDPLLGELEGLEDSQYKTMEEAVFNTYKRRLDDLYGTLSAKEKEFVPLSSKYEFELARQLAKSLSQVHDYKYAYNKLNDYSKRDFYMAQNTLWVLDLLGGSAKIALWAHNGHVADDPALFSGSGSQGSYLRDSLGDQYKIIGFGFSKGSFTAVAQNPTTQQYEGLKSHTITAEPKTGSTNELFHAAKEKKFLLRLDSLEPASPLRAWLSSSRYFLSIGAVFNGNPDAYYYLLPLLQHFDILVYFDTTAYASQTGTAALSSSPQVSIF
jgi:erythromycin esterase